jgi:hypothetical protein
MHEKWRRNVAIYQDIQRPTRPESFVRNTKGSKKITLDQIMHNMLQIYKLSTPRLIGLDVEAC